jgi:hypothetical protein
MNNAIKSFVRFSKYNLSVVLVFMLLSKVSFGQVQVSTDTLSLETFTRSSQTYWYSSGHRARAESIATFLADASQYFQQTLQFTPVTNIYILAPKDWKAVAAKPLHDVYGFPHNLDHSRLVMAAEDNDFWRSFLPPEDRFPMALASSIKQAYRQPNGTYSLMAFFDLLALHELGHSYTAQAGLTMQRHWMSELFVNIMLHTYIAEKHPKLLPALETFPTMIVNAGSGAYNYTNLKDFERLYPTLGMGANNYGWYQCQLHTAAKEVYAAGGPTVMKKLWDALLKYKKNLSDEELVNMLRDEVHPSVAQVYTLWDNRK